MAYNQNYKYQQNQQKKGIRGAKESKRELNKQHRFVVGLSDPTWWASLTTTQKELVYECYVYCVENAGDDGFFYYNSNRLLMDDGCFMEVNTPEKRKEWEDKVMSVVGSKKKIRQMKLKELGL